MKVRKAVIAAAGWGTRFLPITKSVPKELLPVVDKPIIQYAVEEAVACGIEQVIIVTTQGKKAIEDYFDKNVVLEHVLEQRGKADLLQKIRRLPDMADFYFVRQKEPLGLGHAVLSARAVVGEEPFALILPDDLLERKELVLKRMLEIFQEYHSSVIALKQVGWDELQRYGVVRAKKIAADIFQVMDLVEKPKPSQSPSALAIMGRYVLTPEILVELASTPPGAGGEIQLTDGLKRLLVRQAIYGCEFEGECYDAGTISGWVQTTVALALKHPEIGPEIRSYLRHLLQQNVENSKS
jgi:UTP--glucose-1-phosphate uridylyltransferase